MLALPYPGLEGVTEVDTDPKWGFASFMETSSNETVPSPSGHSTREQLAMGRFFEVLQIYTENRNEGNENKMILGEVNCTMQKMDRDGGNNTQRRYKCCSNYATSNLILDNGLEDL